MNIANRVKENASGTTVLTLLGAVDGYCRFSDVITVDGGFYDGAEFSNLGVRYLIEWAGGWEIGIGALDPVNATSLTRLVIESSSALPGGSDTVELLPSGDKTVSLVASAESLPVVDGVTVVADAAGLLTLVKRRKWVVIGSYRSFIDEVTAELIDGAATVSVVLPPDIFPASRGIIRLTVGVPSGFVGARVVGEFRYVGDLSWGYNLAGGAVFDSASSGANLVPSGNLSAGAPVNIDLSGFTGSGATVMVLVEVGAL